MFELRKISKSFKDGEKEKIIFKGCSFRFPEKGMVFVVGKSGCGKSTLLNLLASFDSPDEGEIIFLDKNINNLREQDLVGYYQHEIGFIFQEYNLIDSLNVFENIAISSNAEKNQVKEVVSSVLNIVNLGGYGHRKISQLSGGQKQRVAIARALCSNVKVLLCDEPTGALDKDNSTQVYECLKSISQTSLVIIVSHDTEAAQKYADTILTIEEGKLLSTEKSFVYKEPYKVLFNPANCKRNINVGKIGLSFALSKKIRIAIAIILMTISLSAFGLSSSLLTFTKTDAVLNHMEENNLNYLSYQKVLDYEIDGRKCAQEINMSASDINNIKDYIGLNVLPKYSYFDQKNINTYKNNSSLYSNVINGFCEINAQVIEELGFDFYGNLPSNDNEVVITDYMFQVFKRDGYKSPAYEIYEIATYEDIVGKELQLSAFENFVTYDVYKIVGILDTQFNEKMFDELDDKSSESNDELNNQLKAYLKTSLDQTIFLKEGYYFRNIKIYNDNHYLKNSGITVNNCVISYLNNFNELSYVFPTSMNVIFKNGSLDNLGIVLPLESFETTETHCLKSYTVYYAESVFQTIETEFKNDWGEESTYYTYASYLAFNDYKDTEYLEISKIDLTRWCVNKFIEDHGLFETNNYSIAINVNNSNALFNLELQGISYGENQKTVYLSMENYNKLLNGLSYYKNDISMCYLPLSDNKSANKKLVKLDALSITEQPGYILDTSYKVNKAYVAVNNLSTYIYDRIDDRISFYKTILIIIGGALFAFSIFFMSFDIKGIVSIKQKEIGILKSLGVNVKKVLGSFIVYATIFTIATSLLSNITCIFANSIIAELINTAYHCHFKFINYSFVQGISGFLITFIFCSTISIISIIKTYKKRTIDLIR